jgi:hypothetical protein
MTVNMSKSRLSNIHLKRVSGNFIQKKKTEDKNMKIKEKINIEKTKSIFFKVSIILSLLFFDSLII